MMSQRIYTVHACPWSASNDGIAVFVCEGFNWSALVFGPFWALCLGLWRTGIVLFVISALVPSSLVVLGISNGASFTITMALQVAFGFWANDWRRYVLGRRDFPERAVVLGRNLRDAEHHYFGGGR